MLLEKEIFREIIKIVLSTVGILIILLGYCVDKEQAKESNIGEPEIRPEVYYMYYKQYDERWAEYPFSCSTMENSGCGPSSVANLVYFKDQSVNPVTMADWLTNNGYSTYGNGTARDGINASLAAYGYTVYDTYYGSDVITYFDSEPKMMGVLLVSDSAGGITWTYSGHYITVYDYKIGDDGLHYLLIADSSDRNNDGWFCFETQIEPCLVKAWLCC